MMRFVFILYKRQEVQNKLFGATRKVNNSSDVSRGCGPMARENVV